MITAVGRDRPGIVEELTRIVAECGCNVGESRMTVLGAEFAGVALLTGNWNAIAKLEQALPRLEEKLDLSIQARRTEPRTETARLVPYGIEVVSLEQPGIVHEVAGFFAQSGIGIEDLYTSRYPAPHTAAPMFTLHMTVGIPSDTTIAAVRGEFMDFCDDLNLDAMMAPVK